MSQKTQIVLLCADGDSTYAVYQTLRKAFGEITVVMEDSISRWQLIRRRAQKLGVPAVFGQLIFMTLVVPVLRRANRRRIAELKESLGFDKNIPADKLIRVDSVNSDRTREILRELAPEVVVVNGTRIIGKKTLQSVNAVFINTHAGITPLYRGVHGAYWALAENRKDLVGTTIHYVDEGIDTGNIIAQAFFEVSEKDDFATYPYLHTQAGLPFLIEAVGAALKNEPRKAKAENDLPSKLRYHPTVWQYFYYKYHNGAR